MLCAMTPEQFLEKSPPAVQETALQACAVLCRLVPGLEATVYASWRLIGFGYVAGMQGQFFSLRPHADRVELHFFDGALLDDPEGLLEGEGRRIRIVTLRAPEEVDRPALHALVRQAALRRPPPDSAV